MTENVSEWVGATPNAEMSLVGYAMIAGMAVLLLPLLPFVVLLWLLGRIRESGGGESAR